MHSLFNLSNERGLSNFLQDEIAHGSLAGLVQQSAISNLHVLTAGPETRAAAHLFYSTNFAALIETLRGEYDMILIDTPPILHMTDARIVSRHADAVVLLARAGDTTRDTLLAAKERFQEDRIRILGGILNNWDPERAARTYYKSNGRSEPYRRSRPQEIRST
jgi:polysaccharide biosynthesis transport protein